MANSTNANRGDVINGKWVIGYDSIGYLWATWDSYKFHKYCRIFDELERDHDSIMAYKGDFDSTTPIFNWIHYTRRRNNGK